MKILSVHLKNRKGEVAMAEEIKQEALKIRSQGLSVFSTKVDKTPAIRKQNRIVELRSKLQTTAEMEIDFSHPQVAGIAVNCGPIPDQNRDLECLDIDCPNLSKTFLDELCASTPELGEKLKGCVEKTPSEGLHIFYYLPLGKSKCRDLAMMSPERNKNWLTEARARGSTKMVAPPLIETKGAGGYVVGFCSKAISKIDGTIKSYEMLHGNVESIPTLSAQEHDFLLAFAGSYDERSLKKFVTANPEPIQKYESDKRAALEQWRAETPWNEILPESYKVVEVKPDYYICWHPDSSDLQTPNAVCGAKAGGLDRYWSFSPNDWRLPANTPLTKDYVFCASRGWVTGSKEWKTFYATVFAKYAPKFEVEPINMERIDEFFEEATKGKPKNKIKVKKYLDVIPDESIDFPGWINTYVDYCMRNALYPEKRIAVASALGMFSALIGRAVMGPGELKLNLYMVVLGLTANGKDYPRKLNARICMEIDEADLLLTKVGSREGLEEKVMQGPKFLMADEGAFDLEKMKSGDIRYTDVMGSLLELFTSNYIKRRARAGEDDDGNYIRYPFLSVMTSSTPEEYFKALSPKFIRSGFYNRLLILQASLRGRMNVRAMTTTEPIPEFLIETAAKLVAMNGNLVPGDARRELNDMGVDQMQNESLNKIENDARIMQLSEDALQYFQEEVWKNDDSYSEYQKRGEEEKAASCARLPEMALKVSCLWELSRDIKATELSLEAVMAGMRFVKEVNSRQTANTVMISDTKFGEITDKLIKLVETSGVEIEPGVSGIKMTEAKKFLRKSVHNGQSVDDAIRYLQDCGEIKVKRASSGNTMYLIINDQQPSQSQPLEQPKAIS
ncbi:MAG: hypothetical protein EBR30_10660 [Cytophagia bacterium]|nr:hypothetical protein [Cytophagia bacterium]